jgi:transcriptional regulator with XRE-family HTH domain
MWRALEFLWIYRNHSVICVLVITAHQCRAARGLLAWTQQDLADRAAIGIVTVHQLEAGTSQPRRATMDVVRRAFEAAGVAFIEQNGGGVGVRFRTAQQAKQPK